MAFMFIVTILVIAICRVQIKRAMNSRCSQQNRNTCTRRTVPLYDLDVYLNRTADVNYPGGKYDEVKKEFYFTSVSKMDGNL